MEQSIVTICSNGSQNEDGIAKSVDPDLTGPLGSVRSGSALFVQTCPSQYLFF